MAASNPTLGGRGPLDSSVVTRVVTAAVGIPLVVAVDLVGGYVFEAVIVLVAMVAAGEAFRMLTQRNHHPALIVGLVMTTVLAIGPATGHPHVWWQATVVIGTILAAIWMLWRATNHDAFIDWALTVVIAVYAGGLAGSLVSVRLLHNGVRLALLVLVLTWAYDTGAYIAGRTVGRTPFMQNLSQSKTLEGVAGGLALSIIVGIAASSVANIHIALAFVAAVAIAIATQAGDLLESLMKRYSGVKDSGTLIPGHGGLLDRIDGLLFSGTAAYYVFLLAGLR